MFAAEMFFVQGLGDRRHRGLELECPQRHLCDGFEGLRGLDGFLGRGPPDKHAVMTD